MNEKVQSSCRSDRIGSAETSSFKQIIREVEKLMNDDDDQPISTFDAEPPKMTPHMTNGQKLSLLMKNSATRQKLTEFMKENGFLELFPILKVRISPGHVQYQVQHSDLVEVFSRFDKMERIIIHQAYIFVFYSDHLSAYFAQKSLNDISLETIGAKLVVEWCHPEEYVYISQYLNFERNSPPELVRNNSLSNSKFTCRYQIQIDNDKEFQVARRIIGSKGCNMKNIIDACLSQIGADPKIDTDSIKLRLRGKGSGYREGVNKMQSDDPLHLCVSCKDETAYNKACKMVQDLLKSIYQEYKTFCLKNNRPYETLNIKKLDFNFTLRKNSMYNFQQSQSERMSQSDIKMYIEARNKARRQLNFTEADNIRNFLKSKGITLIDEKGGRGRGIEVTTWRFTS